MTVSFQRPLCLKHLSSDTFCFWTDSSVETSPFSKKWRNFFSSSVSMIFMSSNKLSLTFALLWLFRIVKLSNMKGLLIFSRHLTVFSRHLTPVVKLFESLQNLHGNIVPRADYSFISNSYTLTTEVSSWIQGHHLANEDSSVMMLLLPCLSLQHFSAHEFELVP